MGECRNVLEAPVGVGRPVVALGRRDPPQHAAETVVVAVLHEAGEAVPFKKSNRLAGTRIQSGMMADYAPSPDLPSCPPGD